MNLFNGGVEEDTLQVLHGSSGIATEDLIRRVHKKRGSVTKQGVYRVLRKLKKEGKVVIYRSSVSISALWIERLRSWINKRSAVSIFGDLSAMRENEKIIIEGRTLTGTDDLWSEAFINVENKTNAKHPLFLYNPHNWSMLFRPETDKMHVDRLNSKRRPIFLSIGSRTPMDRETVRIVSQGDIHCSLSSSLRSSNYIAVIGDFVFTVKPSRRGSDFMDRAFKESFSVDKTIQDIKMLDRLSPAKIIIERNANEARRLKKKIARDFFVPKENKDF